MRRLLAWLGFGIESWVDVNEVPCDCPTPCGWVHNAGGPRHWRIRCLTAH